MMAYIGDGHCEDSIKPPVFTLILKFHAYFAGLP